MENKEYKVSREFLLEAYSAACPDWKDRIKAEIPEAFKKTYRLGDKFKHFLTNTPYMIASAGADEMILISMTHGSRWNDAVKVSDAYAITEEEFNRLTLGKPANFVSQDFEFRTKK